MSYLIYISFYLFLFIWYQYTVPFPTPKIPDFLPILKLTKCWIILPKKNPQKSFCPMNSNLPLF